MNNYSNDNYQQNEDYDYSANRCRICNSELRDPRQLYGEWCARKNGLDPYGGPADADKKEKIEFIAANNYDNNELKIPTIDNLTYEEYNEHIEDQPAFAEYMLYHTNTHNSGNHIPYWEGIDESAYATRVHYNHFPNAYPYGNLIYDINDYIYNGNMDDELKNWLEPSQ